MKTRFLFVITAFLLLFLALNYYVGWHGWLFLSTTFNMSHSILYWILFWLVSFSYILARLSSRFVPNIVFITLKIIGSYWIACMLYAVLLLPFADITSWLLQAASIQKSEYILISGITILLLIVIILARGSWNAWNPIIRQYELTITKAAGELKQLRIAVASDLHLGNTVGNRHLELLVERMNGLKPDLILMPGDIIDDDIAPFIRHGMADKFKQLQAKFGVYAILGNHEYIGGHIEEFVSEMKKADVTVLMDRSIKIADSFYIIGRKDKSAERFGPEGRLSIDALLTDTDRTAPLIMMDHQPYQLGIAEAAGIDVMLSGHTHRGQMAPVHWITKRLFELDWGYLQKGQLHAVVSSGYGTWGPPIRLGSRSEIIELVIRFETPTLK